MKLTELDRKTLADNPFWFVPIPRTGSSTIRKQFTGFQSHEGNVRGHGAVSNYQNLFGDQLWQSLFTFTLVRNPWDRAVSWYLFNRNRWGFRGTFSNFLYSKQSSGWYWNCSDYIDGSIDFVGRFETIQRDYNIICDHIDREHVILPKLNTSNRTTGEEYYDERLINRVAKLCKKDIEQFGYQYKSI